DRLFVVTREGQILCYGADPAEPVTHSWTPRSPEKRTVDLSYAVSEGYAVRIGEADLPSLLQFTDSPALHTIAIDPDPDRVNSARRGLAAAGLLGERSAVHVGDARFQLPPYLANTIVCDLGAVQAESVRHLYDALRPYGGRLHLLKQLVSRQELDAWTSDGSLAAAAVEETDTHYVLIRSGALPGSADWTHEHADPANTRVSKDSRVRAPLGLL